MRSRFLWRAYKARYRDQVAELAAIQHAIRSDQIVCDVGANKGSYTYWLSRWAKGVVAFEPQPSLATYLEEACRRLNLSNVVVERAAAGQFSGMFDLYVPSPGSPGASLIPLAETPKLKVRVIRLDDYFKRDDRVGVLKIDVEGAELDVFKGADRILRTDRPLIVFECEQRHLQNGSVQDVLNHLKQLRYRGKFVRGARAFPIDDFELQKDQAQSGDRYWDAKSYCNNFIFKPED